MKNGEMKRLDRWGYLLGFTSLIAGLGVGLTVRTASIGLERVAVGFELPTHLHNAADGSGRLFVLEKAGLIRIRLSDGNVLPEPFLDIRESVRDEELEQGLFSIAFHPAYAENGRFFLSYSGLESETVLAEFGVSEDPDRADPRSKRTLLEVAQPGPNHNGAQLQFGPDGYLYFGLGEGGVGTDPADAQNLESFLGKLLRIDVDQGFPYAIPPDNPFADDPFALDEIWASGLRNPWRFSFDRATGSLFIADVGSYSWEEVNVELAPSRGGRNYGWDTMEGEHCYRPRFNCDQGGLTLPVVEYGRDAGCAITGGYVYRGDRFPDLAGTYFFGDWCSGRIWGLKREAAGAWSWEQVLDSDLFISSFGEDEEGELYVTDYRDGGIYRVIEDSSSFTPNLSVRRGQVLTFLLALGATFFMAAFLAVRARALGIASAALVSKLGGVAVALGCAVGISVAVLLEAFYSQPFALQVDFLLAALAAILIAALLGALADVLGLGVRTAALLPLLAALPLTAVQAGGVNLGTTDIGNLYPFVVLPLTVLGSANIASSVRGTRSLEQGLGLLALGSLAVIAAGLEARTALLLLLPALAAGLAGATLMAPSSGLTPGRSGAFAVGTVVAAAVVIGKFEAAGPIVLALFALDFALKARHRFAEDCWSADVKDGRLHCPPSGPKSLCQLVMKLTGGVSELHLVLLLIGVQVLLGLLAILFYAPRFEVSLT